MYAFKVVCRNIERNEKSEDMKIIGITGGVGSGKSAILDIFKQNYQSFVVQADLVAHELMMPGNISYIKIVDFFGKSILNEDDTINRKLLGEIVFSKKEKLEILNSFVHPEVKNRIKELIQEKKESKNCEFFLIEAALLLEDHYDEICDEIWYVYANHDVRVERLKASRGYTEEKIKNMMNNQLSEEEFRRRCNRTIDNSKSMEDTKEQIKNLLNTYFL